MKNSRFIVKGLLAVFVGLPITVVVGFMSIVALFIGVASVTEVPAVRNIGAGVVVTIWASAGLLGLAGFWMWIFMPRSAGRVRRVINAVMITGGIAAISLLVVTEEPVMTAFAIIGMAAGLVIVAWLLKPDLPGNPDAPVTGSTG